MLETEVSIHLAVKVWKHTATEVSPGPVRRGRFYVKRSYARAINHHTNKQDPGVTPKP